MWGLLAGLFNSIPYMGPLLVTGGLALVAFMQFNDLARSVYVSGVAFAITSLEGFLLTPMMMGRAAQMNPVRGLRRPAVLVVDVGRVGHGPRRADADDVQGHVRPRRGSAADRRAARRIAVNLVEGLSPLELPDTLSRAPLRRRARAWLARCARSRPYEIGSRPAERLRTRPAARSARAQTRRRRCSRARTGSRRASAARPGCACRSSSAMLRRSAFQKTSPISPASGTRPSNMSIPALSTIRATTTAGTRIVARCRAGRR